MFEPMDLHKHISNIRSLLNLSFQTVMDEFRFTREMLPENPAFLDEAAILEYAENRMMSFYGYWEGGALVSCYALSIIPEVHADLERVCVRPDKRHRGIGRKLLQDTATRVSYFNVQTVKIAVINENIRLKNWYSSFGFKEISVEAFDHLPFMVCYMEYPIDITVTSAIKYDETGTELVEAPRLDSTGSPSGGLTVFNSRSNNHTSSLVSMGDSYKK
jgi:diamine N-acetyltransferase